MDKKMLLEAAQWGFDERLEGYHIGDCPIHGRYAEAWRQGWEKADLCLKILNNEVSTTEREK